jgi:hypothetical protein
MGLIALAAHAGIVGVLIFAIAVALRYGPDAVLRLIAGLTHMFARNETRSQRGLNVLTALRPGPAASPDSREPRPLGERPGLDGAEGG